MDIEEGRLAVDELGELLEAVGAGVEARVELPQVEADLAEVGPAVVVDGHVESPLQQRHRVELGAGLAALFRLLPLLARLFRAAFAPRFAALAPVRFPRL